MSEGLFETHPLTLQEGQRVRVQLVHGDEEATFLRYCQEDGFPMAKVQTRTGVAVLNVARVSPATSPPSPDPGPSADC